MLNFPITLYLLRYWFWNHEAILQRKVKVLLKDGSVIFLREIIIQNVLFDYSYHWQKADGALIIRWDNAAHYRNIPTHPHHKHIGSETDVQPSYE